MTNKDEREAVADSDTARRPLEDSGLKLHPSLRGARAVLFDAGGTLVHPDWPRLARLAEEETGRAFSEAELQRALKESLRDAGVELQQQSGVTPLNQRRRGWVFHGMYRALGLDEGACEPLNARVDREHGERHLWCGLDRQAPEVLSALKSAGLRIAVISNTEDGRLSELLELVDIAAHFELLIDSHVVGVRKPNAAIFRMALDGLGVAAEDAVYVGDSYAQDALAAEAAGLRPILLDPLGLHPEAACPRISSLAGLIGRDESLSEQARTAGGE